MENIILVDYKITDNWEFQEAIEKATQKKWRVIESVSNMNHGSKLQKLIRYIKYFWFPFKIFLKHKEFSSILAWQQFYGIVLAFYFSVFRIKNAPDITVMTFIYKPKKGFVGAIYKCFMKSVIKAGYIKKFIVFSRSEPEYYANVFGVSKELFVSELLGIEDQGCQHLISDNGSFISAGRSNRDYDFIRNNWPTDAPVVEIICDVEKSNSTRSRENIKYLKDCYGELYIQKLSQCHAVILSLSNEKISSGQLVILQAMMLGKPVISTKNDSILEYVLDGKTGIIINKDREELRRALKTISDPQVYERMSINARKCFVSQFSSYAMGMRIGKSM